MQPRALLQVAHGFNSMLQLSRTAEAVIPLSGSKSVCNFQECLSLQRDGRLDTEICPEM